MNKVEMIMRKIIGLGHVNADSADVKRWLDDYEEIHALVELSEKELEQVAGGYGDSGHLAHAGSGRIDQGAL